MFQLGLFFDRQPDFQPYFFVVGTQSNSSILSNFRCGRGYSGVSPGNGFCPVGGEIRCSLSLWTAIPVDRGTAGDGVLPPLKIFLPPPLQLSMPKTELFLGPFSSFLLPEQIKKPITYTTAPAGRPSPRWCSFWFVYVTGFYCFSQYSLFSWRSHEGVL